MLKQNLYMHSEIFFKAGVVYSFQLLIMLFWGWHHFLFIYLIFASWQLGRVFRGVYTGDLFPLIRHVLWWIQGLLEKGGGGGGGGGGGVRRKLIHSFSCVPACSAHSLPLSISLPPLFLETSHSRESGPSCSQRLGLASSRLLLLCARVSAVYDIRREESRAGRNGALHLSLSDQAGQGRISALQIFNSPYLHSWQVVDGCVLRSLV